jgi:hypothetical protein
VRCKLNASNGIAWRRSEKVIVAWIGHAKAMRKAVLAVIGSQGYQNAIVVDRLLRRL